MFYCHVYYLTTGRLTAAENIPLKASPAAEPNKGTFSGDKKSTELASPPHLKGAQEEPTPPEPAGLG